METAKISLNFFWKNKFRVACVLVAAAVLLSGANFIKNNKRFTATLSLNYSEASEGLNPNKTRFNSYELLSTAVLKSAIQLCGLEGTLTPQQLQNCLDIAPVDTGNASSSNEYISTTYRISFNSSSIKIGNVKSMDILKNVCYAYQLYFMENYGDNQSLLQDSLKHTKSSEPYIRVSEIKTAVNRLSRYLQSRLNENKTFADTETGASFTEIEKELSNIINYDIPNTTAFIIEEGIAESSGTLTKILEYKNKMQTISYNKSMAYYNADKGGINMYDTTMSSVVMIPTKDDTDDYYMSRTKTAMDYMAKAADSEADDISSYNKEIISTKYVMDCIAKNASKTENLKAANEMVNKLEEAIQALSNRFLKLDKAYVEYKSKNYVKFNFQYLSFVEKIELRAMVLWLLALTAAWYLLLILKNLARGQRHEKV